MEPTRATAVVRRLLCTAAIPNMVYCKAKRVVLVLVTYFEKIHQDLFNIHTTAIHLVKKNDAI